MPRTLTLMLTVLILATPAWGQPPNRSEVTAVFFQSDGKTAIAACLDDKLHVYDAATGKEQHAVEAHKDGVWAAVLSPDGKYLATGGGDSLVRLWDAGELKLIRSFEGHRKEVLAVAFAPDGKSLAAGCADGSIRIWEVASGKQLASWQAHEIKVLSVAFASDGKTLASGGTCTALIPGVARGAIHADYIRLWNPETGKPARQHTMRGTVVRYSPDGRTLLAAGNYVMGRNLEGGGTLRSSGTKVALGMPGRDGEWAEMKGIGSTAAFSPDGRLVSVAYGDRLHVAVTGGKYRFENEIRHRRITLWEAATGQQILEIPEEEATAVAISPDGTKLMAGFMYLQVQFHALKPPGLGDDKASRPEAKDLDRLWADLAGAEAGPAYLALRTFAVKRGRAGSGVSQREIATRKGNRRARARPPDETGQ